MESSGSDTANPVHLGFSFFDSFRDHVLDLFNFETMDLQEERCLIEVSGA